jgi:hypothetical protein
VVPVIFRPVNWQSTPLGKLQALPTDGKPISKWSNSDEAFQSVLEGLRRAVRELREGSSGAGNGPASRTREQVSSRPRSRRPVRQMAKYLVRYVGEVVIEAPDLQTAVRQVEADGMHVESITREGYADLRSN